MTLAALLLAVELPLVTVCRVRHGVTFEDRIPVQGTVRARESAAIAARLPGTIDELCVAEGDRVKLGDVLFRVDRTNLENAVRAAEDDLAMAQAKLGQAEVQQEKAATDSERLARLLAAKAVTRDLAEQAEVAAKGAVAALNVAKASVTRARTALAVARKNLADSEAKAPFAGVVVRKHHEAGDYVGPGARVFDLENDDACELRFSLNAADYPKVRVGQTDVIVAGHAEKVTYKSPTVSPLTRTFEIRLPARLDDTLAPGMIVDADVRFSTAVSDALPASAVNRIDGQDTVFAVKGGKVTALKVEAGVEQNGLRAVKGVPDETEVVESAMLLLNPGEEVRTAPCR